MAGNDMRQNVRRARDTFGKLTPGQKVGLGATVMTIVVGAFVLTSLSPETKMSPLYTDLDATDASAIVDELAGRGVQYDLTDAGHTVLVPSADVYDLRVAMSGSGLPSSNDGYALLDKQGITTSEFRQRIDYQRALEGELSNTLQAMDGVAAATVHLALPEESVFVDEAGHPTASVLIESRGLTELGGDQVDAIVHLVASSVKNMEPADVTVIGAAGQVLSSGGSGLTSGGSARTSAETDFEKDLAASLTAMIARVTGPGHVAVTVSADLDLSQRQSTSEVYEPGGVDAEGQIVSGRSSTETYSDAAAVAEDTGVLGPDGVVVTPDVGAVPGANDYEKVDTEQTYALDKVVEQVIEAPGAIQRLNVAVLIDEAAVTDAQITQIESMVATASGIDAERGDGVVVTRLPFDTTAVDTATADAEAAAAVQAKADQMALYRTLAIVAVAIVALILAYRSTRKARRVVNTPIELGVITAMGHEPLMVEGGDEHDYLPVAPASGAVAGKELAEMAERRPEDVANVLKSWLSETPAGRG
jgi:flagellar M-ring protein FliF